MMSEWIKGLDPATGAVFWVLVVLLGLIGVSGLLVFVIRKALKVEDNEERFSKMERQVTAIESCVCSMGGLSERLIEIERRTMSQGKMLSALTSHLKEIINEEEKE
ncbi:MAG: hypothetical protein IID32_10100 [Planctomycetes bacterium]|nr:hypothetical protein [Planctomycetota bacterium]